MSETPRVSFRSSGDFLRETKQEVDAYLQEPRTRRIGKLKLYAKAPVAVGLMAAAWVGLLLAHDRPALAIVCLALLAAGSILTSFCVQHDANHGSYFRSRRSNHLLGWTSDTLLGISSYAWRVKHNVAHHTYTNIDAMDADVTQMPFARFAPSQSPRWWYRFQHIYIWPLYAFMGIRWQFAGDAAAFIRGRIGTSTLRFPRGWNLVALTVGKAIFVLWVFVLPLFFYPWTWVVVGYLAFMAVTSMVMAITFQLAHCVEEADFPSLHEAQSTPRDWATHEVETTVNFCPRNWFLTWTLGGLNYQIEHHLFPGVAHTHYPAISKIVQRNAARHGIRYVVHDSLYAALRSHVRHLRAMGQLGLPVVVEMG